MLIALLAQAPELPPLDQACGVKDPKPWLCDAVFDLTDNQDVAHVAKWLSPWVSLVLIALGAFVVNRLARRVVRRSVRRWERVGQFTRGRRMLKVFEATSPTPTIRRHQRAETMAAGLSSMTTIVVVFIAVILALGAFGIQMATLLTSAGLLGVALGFGAQNLLRDLIAGGFMIFQDQLGVWDVVDLGVAPTGTVEEVTLRSTRIRDVEGVVWYVPNGGISRVGNKSQQWSRAVIDVPISTTADIDQARQVISETAETLASEDAWAAAIIDAPEVWGVESFTREALTIRLVVKTAPHEQWRVARELRARVKRALDAAGIESTAPEIEAVDPESPAAG
jgi:small-conductance mechanosensitive channel